MFLPGSRKGPFEASRKLCQTLNVVRSLRAILLGWRKPTVVVDVQGATGPMVLDLKDVSVVDRAGVLVLARSEARGATLLNCPSYVREWIHSERQFARSEQRAGGRRSEEDFMESDLASAAREETLETQGLK